MPTIFLKNIIKKNGYLYPPQAILVTFLNSINDGEI